MITTRHLFETGPELAEAMALDVSGWLKRAISLKGSAVLAVSGGATPKLFFAALSNQELDWSKVTITLVDERKVPEDNPRSNARLVRDNLWRNQAAVAQFAPLYLNPFIDRIAQFDVAILGMGNDGHTASFFPGGDNLAKAIDKTKLDAVLDMNAEGAGETRLTFTLPRLLAATHLCLHIQGQEKMQVLEKALAGTDALKMPVRAVLHAAEPLDLYWCP